MVNFLIRFAGFVLFGGLAVLLGSTASLLWDLSGDVVVQSFIDRLWLAALLLGVVLTGVPAVVCAWGALRVWVADLD